MKKFQVTGMSCAACQARVEKAVKSVQGVMSCEVSLLTNSMTVDGNFIDKDIVDAVKSAGYGIKRMDESFDEESLSDTETPILVKRLVSSIVFLLLLMYVSMGHNMLKLPLPIFLQDDVKIGFTQLILTIIVMIINRKFFISGFKSLIKKAPNMDTLVALGSGVSFIWSVYALCMMIAAKKLGADTSIWLHELYFESAAMILTLITVGKMLEARSKGKTTDALRSLIKLSPKVATIIADGVEKEVDIESVKKGDLFVVKKGEIIPVDGVIIDGSTFVDESTFSGESEPVEKRIGTQVSAATTNMGDTIKCEALRVGDDTTLSQIIRMVSNASASKAPIAKIADKVSGIFVPTVIAISIITFVVWMIKNAPIDFALARAISVLVISCPCALGLATPVAIMVGSGIGAKHGILFKTATSLEITGKTQIVVLDKTGTITYGIVSAPDKIKEDSASAISILKKMGIQVVMLSGDKIEKAQEIALKVGIENVVAKVLPDGKDKVVNELKNLGKVAMVGDGINDAIALKTADVGIAIGAGTDVAIDAADIVLINSHLTDVVALIRLSKAVIRNIYENLFWAFFYNVIGIPIAAGCFIEAFGLKLSPMFGALAMSLSSFFVVSNALRLNLYDIYKDNNTKIKNPISKNLIKTIINKINMEKETDMEKEIIVKIDGMMCGHCEAHMTEAFMKLDGVKKAKCSHVDKKAVLTVTKDISKDIIEKTVKATGYKYLG